MPSLKTEIVFAFTLHGLNFWVWPQVLQTFWVVFFSFFVGLRQQTGYAAAHLEVSGLELTPGILPSNGCMMKTRRNLTDWAEVPITTQPVVSLPGTKD